MAFDMHAGSKKEKIQHQEERLFALINGDYDNYPVLNEIWESYYDDPRISYEKANILVHELLKLQSIVEKNKNDMWLAPSLNRLAGFFNYANTNHLQINCISD